MAAAELKLQLYRRLEDLPFSSAEIFEAVSDFSLSKEWFRNVVENGIHPQTEACFGALTLGEAAIAIIPLQCCHGGSLNALTNCYTCVYHPLASPEIPVLETACLLGRAVGRFCLNRPPVRIDCLPADWSALDAFTSGLREAGLVLRRFDHFGNWYEPMEGRSWDDYLSSRPSNLRELLRRRHRRAARQGELTFEIIHGGQELARGIGAYEAVYERSWKPREPFPRFNAGLMREAARLGVLHLGLCWRAEEPIAAQLWIVAHGKATVMKLAHDEKERPLSPGTLLMAAVIKQLIEVGVNEIDFGRGDDAYKRLWASYRRQRIGLILANPRRVRGFTALARHDIGRIIRRLQRSVSGGRAPSYHANSL